MKKLLFIAYYFPPAGGSAVQRCFKFAKYLPEYGWDPFVLTAREKDYALIDASLQSEIPESMHIYRTPAPDLYGLYAGGQKKSVDIAAMSKGRSPLRQLIQKFVLFIRTTFFIPDARIGWLPFAVFKGLKLIHKEKIDIIFTSSPPFTTALIGSILSRITKKPWISDYRDPWTQAYFYFKRPEISQWIENKLEKRMLTRPKKLISINNYILDDMIEKYNLHQEISFQIIPNGYDSNDFLNIQPIQESNFTITYTGTLNAKMHPGYFIEAVRGLIQVNADFAEQIHLKFIGRMGPDQAALFDCPELKGKTTIIPHLPHQECLNHTTGSHLLLLLIPETSRPELIVTGKLFEYMRSGAPVLGLVPQGEAAKIIQQTKTGFTVEPTNVRKIRETVECCFRNWKDKKPILPELPDQKMIAQYDRRLQTGDLAKSLSSIGD